ncbi:hypothetical protein [Streptomyces coerulescens]|uniref:Uncharacterized protein n=1 Tax=Streptomyces coerulescens TaxID=29304 RepID=A0ABW0CWM6_STRCD
MARSARRRAHQDSLGAVAARTACPNSARAAIQARDVLHHPTGAQQLLACTRKAPMSSCWS